MTELFEELTEHMAQFAVERDRVWIHAPDGSTVGRFSLRGIDIHRPITEQIEGKGECLHCTLEPATTGDWQYFREMAEQLWGVSVAPDSIDQCKLIPGPPSEAHHS